MRLAVAWLALDRSSVFGDSFWKITAPLKQVSQVIVGVCVIRVDFYGFAKSVLSRLIVLGTKEKHAVIIVGLHRSWIDSNRSTIVLLRLVELTELSI